MSPDDREAIFETIDSEVAAETLSEIDPDIQASILESLETEKAADIVEEMSPDEAAESWPNSRGDIEEILEEMEPEPKTEVRELLEFQEDSAGGLMNTEYVAFRKPPRSPMPMSRSCGPMRRCWRTLNTIFLVDADERLKGAVPLASCSSRPARRRCTTWPRRP